VLLVVGLVLLFIPFVCVGGIALAVVGFILMIVGIVQEESRPMYSYPPMYMQPAYPPYPASAPLPQPGQPQPAGPPTERPGALPSTGPPTQTPTAAGGTPHCPRCGQFLQYVYQYQRWYCPAENVYPWG